MEASDSEPLLTDAERDLVHEVLVRLKNSWGVVLLGLVGLGVLLVVQVNRRGWDLAGIPALSVLCWIGLAYTFYCAFRLVALPLTRRRTLDSVLQKLRPPAE
ncbi:hypothetical protein ACFL59_08720 [Planctomycetota bacterium]